VENETRRQDCKAILKLLERLSGESPRMWGNSMVGFGSYHYKYASGREGDWFITGFAPRKNDLTIYVMPCFENYTELLQRLGKHKTGKLCLYIKKLADVDMKVLEQLLARGITDMNQMYP
jgi:hypothetical protein